MNGKRIIKSLSILLILIMIITAFAPLSALAYTLDNSITFSLSSDATQLVAGSQITVEMSCNLSTGKNVDTFNGTLKYDNTVLSFNLDDEFVTSTETKWNAPEYVDDNGEIMIDTTRSSTNSGKSGLMYTITFDVLKTVDSTDISLLDPINCAYLGTDIWIAGTTDTIPEPPKTNTITYYSNTTDTVTNLPSPVIKDKDATYTIAAGPTRTGYVFNGWNTLADGTGTDYAAGATYTANANLNLYAKWQILTATLTVNPNGGTWDGYTTSKSYTQNYGTSKTINNPTSGPNGFLVQFNGNTGIANTLGITQTKTFSKWTHTGNGKFIGNVYEFEDGTATLTAEYTGNSITLPGATKTGATFKGWYTLATGGTRVGGEGDSYIPTSATTLSAQWQEDTYTLTVDPNGSTWNGSSAVQTFDGTYQSTKQIANPSSLTGYTVKLDNNDGTGAIATLVQKNSFVSWNLSGAGSFSNGTYTYGANSATLTANYSSGDSVTLTTPSRTGYTFDGWYTLATGGTKVSNTYIPASDITLYAHWTPETYTVTLKYDNGTTTDTSFDVTYGQTYGTLPQPTKPGYTFIGWYDQNANEVKETDTVDITGNTILTANWAGAEYTVTFNYNDGVTSDTTGKVNYGAYYGDVLPTPASRAGYTFEGWYTELTAGTKVTNTTKVTETADHTLYGHWTALKYTVTFTNYDGTILEKNTNIQYGNSATYTGATPTRPSTVEADYTFSGWSQDTSNVTSDITAIAQYTETKRKYTVTFYDEDGTTVLGTSTVEYGTSAVAPTNPTKAATQEYTYTFDGWDKDYSNVTGNLSVNAKYTQTKNKYTVTFYDEDKITKLGTSSIEYAGTAIAPTIPTKADSNGYTYTFDKWVDQNSLEDDLTNVIENRDVYATYTSKVIEYTIEYKDTLTATNTNQTKYTVEDGNIALSNLDDVTGFKFEGWYIKNNDGTTTEVTSIDTSKMDNITIYAKWSSVSTPIMYFVKDDSSVDNTQAILYDNFDEAKAYVDQLFANGTTTRIYDLNNDLIYEPKKQEEQKPTDDKNVLYYVKVLATDENTLQLTFDKFNDAKNYVDLNYENGVKVFDINNDIVYEASPLYLKSEKYKIGENNIDEYEKNDVYLNKISPETSVGVFKSNCDTNGTITVYKKDGTIASNEELIGSEMTIKVTKGNQSIELKAIVMGDLDGDGKVTITDLTAANQKMLGVIDINEDLIKATDLDDDGEVTITDIIAINQALLKINKLVYVKGE